MGNNLTSSCQVVKGNLPLILLSRMSGYIVEKETSDARISANETESWMAYTCIVECPWFLMVFLTVFVV